MYQVWREHGENSLLLMVHSLAQKDDNANMAHKAQSGPGAVSLEENE